jgi:hypothetical protein
MSPYPAKNRPLFRPPLAMGQPPFPLGPETALHPRPNGTVSSFANLLTGP